MKQTYEHSMARQFHLHSTFFLVHSSFAPTRARICLWRSHQQTERARPPQTTISTPPLAGPFTKQLKL